MGKFDDDGVLSRSTPNRFARSFAYSAYMVLWAAVPIVAFFYDQSYPSRHPG